jgi:PAS domain S-box-containing protein
MWYRVLWAIRFIATGPAQRRGRTQRMKFLTRNGALAIIALAIAATFAGDLAVELGVAAGVPYVLAVVVSLRLRSSKAVLITAGVVTLLTMVGLLLSPEGGETQQIILNRLYAIIAIWSVAGMGVWLRRSGEQLLIAQLDASAFQAVDEGILVFGLDRRIVALNPAGARMMGIEPADGVGHMVREYAVLTRPNGSEYPENSKIVGMVLADGQPRFTTSETLTRSDGTTMDVERTVSALRDGQGRITSAVQVIRDVTDRHKVERAKSEFLAMTSHELKTPLTAIHAAVGLLASGLFGELPEKAHPMIQAAKRTRIGSCSWFRTSLRWSN